MAQKEFHTEHTEKSSSSNAIPNELAEIGKKRTDEFISLQTELLEKLRETNRQWFDRAQSEATLAPEFASKLTSVRSLPDAMAACQERTARRFEMIDGDGKHPLADTEKFMETSARFMSNDWTTKAIGMST